MKAEDFFSNDDKEAIKAAIVEAEKFTSGEIRVHIEQKCGIDPVKRASRAFAQLRMHRTKHRNGILFYLAVESKVFAVFGDEGIHAKVKQEFWDKLSSTLQEHFRREEFSAGLAAAIKRCGEQLHHYFPRQKNDRDELSNEINFG